MYKVCNWSCRVTIQQGNCQGQIWSMYSGLEVWGACPPGIVLLQAYYLKSAITRVNRSMSTYSTEYLQISARLVYLSTCRPINIVSYREPIYLPILQQGLRIHRFSEVKIHVFILLALDLSICLPADVSSAHISCLHAQAVVYVYTASYQYII